MGIGGSTSALHVKELGELMAGTGKIQTYQDVVEVLLTESVLLPSELLFEVDAFLKKGKKSVFKTKEEFVEDAIRVRHAQSKKMS